MSWHDSLMPVRMQRVALVASADALRGVLLRVAQAGVVDFGDTGAWSDSGSGAMMAPGGAEPDAIASGQDGRTEAMSGEAQLRSLSEVAVRRGEVAALAGWCPASEVEVLRGRLQPLGAAVVGMRPPAGIDPPTWLGGRSPMKRAFAPLLRIYGTVPYADIDPTVAAGLAYVVMFGMMFGDAGHGALLIAAALLLATGRPRRFAGLRRLWMFVAGAGIAATGFGLLYGEFFGPTGILPVLWLSPLERPVQLMIAAIAAGAVLLAISYAIGTTNRWREGGLRLALYSSSGIAGATTFLGLGVITGGVLSHRLPVVVAGAVLAGAGLVMSTIGMFAEAGGGSAGMVRSGVGVVDLVMHLGANTISFARLAAFGMTHAALGWLVWRATTAVAAGGGAEIVLAAAIFVIGNAVAFALELLIAGVQALRLEFYELFSRVFVGTGRPYTPWRIPGIDARSASC
ncbi:V-type ATPase 116kDa subunit family protein [Nocardia nova]|uniref:V-type ATPase 116kDa subunit family protein n=1 Tax=Nocardia nova TaxID=37330 RepID=UPI002157F059|nr:V-type ATPase 116kDa subunit family protein [Nocardia nova]